MKSRRDESKGMKKLHAETSKHLSEDMKGYKKERKYLKKEIKEDKALQKKIKGAKNGKKSCR